MAVGVAACAEILLKGKVIRMKKKLSFLLALVMLFSSLSALAEGSVLENFLAPDAIAKPMARMWFPDASAGVDENDTIAKQINALAEAGFGGVEIAFLADGSNYTNEQLDYAGWGTEAWIELLKKVYRAANSIEGGFVVDLTITSHWPPCLNTIDPNDDAASQELVGTITKVTADMLAAGEAQLVLPETKLKDGSDVFKALALGADAVCVGRAILPSMQAEGAKGVEAYLRQMNAELKGIMARTGFSTPSLIDSSAIHFAR